MFVISATAQQEKGIGVIFKTGMGEMRKIDNSETYPIQNRIETKMAPTWGLGIFRKKQLNDRFSIETQVLYNQINGVSEESFSYNVTHTADDQSFLVPYSVEAITERKAHYLTLNNIFKLHPEKPYSFGLGITINYLISNSVYTRAYENRAPSFFLGSGNDLEKLDLGLSPQFEFQIGQKLTLIAQAYFGILEQEPQNYKSNYSLITGFDPGQKFTFRNRQFTLGLNYIIFKGKSDKPSLE